MSSRESAVPGPAAAGLGLSRPRWGERAIYVSLAACALVSVLTTFGIVLSLLEPTFEFFGEVSFAEFFWGSDWSPLFEPPSFNVPPIVVGTISVTIWALVVAIPAGLGAAIYMSEYASPRVRNVLKPALEVLAGIPTVALGFFALTFITPRLIDIWPGFLGEEPGIFSALSAGIAMGIMIIPIIASISEDAMSAVPHGLREGAFAMGATRMQVATRVVVPAALSGIVAAFVLGISRGVGETMVVLIAAGNSPVLTFDPAASIQTMTAFIATTGTGDVPTGSIEYKTIFAVGTLLFAATFIMNLFSIRLVRRFREVYE